MSGVQHTWKCPKCGKYVPIHMTGCRCGFEDKNAALKAARPAPGGGTMAPGPAASVVQVAKTPVESTPKSASTLKRLYMRLSLIVVILLLAGAVAVLIARNRNARVGGIRVIARLDDYTRSSDPKVANTIPGFLALPGKLGAVESGGDTETGQAEVPLVIKDIHAGELQKGFCSPTLALLIRQQYPGSYEKWSDADLEKVVLQKRPEFRGRLCILPAWIDAAPHDIVKYQ